MNDGTEARDQARSPAASGLAAVRDVLVAFYDNSWASPWAVGPGVQMDVDELIRPEEIFHVVVNGGVRPSAFKLARIDGTPVSLASYTRRDLQSGDLYCDSDEVERLRASCSLVVLRAERFSAHIGWLTGRLEEALRVPVTATLFESPPQSQALKAHVDASDVLIVQLRGSKCWRLYDESDVRARDEEVDPAGSPETHKLTAGDTLFVRRGTPHTATAESGGSVHLSLTVRRQTSAEVLAPAINELLRREPFLALEAAGPPSAERARQLLGQFLAMLRG